MEAGGAVFDCSPSEDLACSCFTAGTIYDQLKDYMIEASEKAILTLAANDVQKNLTLSAGLRFQVCLEKASTKSEYGQCILKALAGAKTSTGRSPPARISRRRGLRKRNADYSYSISAQQQQLDNGTIGSDVADYLTALVREIKNSLPPDSKLLARNIFSQITADQISKNIKRALDFNEDIQAGMKLLSPRVFSVLPDLRRSQSQSILSPDVLSFHDGSDTIASVPSLLSYLPSGNEQSSWLRLIKEATGAGDILRQIVSASESALEVKRMDFVKVTESGVSLEDTRSMQVLLGDSDSDQRAKVQQRGLALMNQRQLKFLKNQSGDPNTFSEPDLRIDNDQVMLREIIEGILSNGRRSDQASSGKRRRKRLQFAKPTFLEPAIGGTIFVIYLLAPSILSPGLLFYLILGPVVLSPFILSPFVLSPFILAPTVLSPFILDPYVLSPFILDPLVLSPVILSPNVLSPTILSPFVLSPSILDPAVGSPLILSPFVLSPFILSPSTLTATILSPGEFRQARELQSGKVKSGSGS